MLRADGIDDGEAEAVASFLTLSARLETLDLSENQVRTWYYSIMRVSPWIQCI